MAVLGNTKGIHEALGCETVGSRRSAPRNIVENYKERGRRGSRRFAVRAQGNGEEGEGCLF